MAMVVRSNIMAMNANRQLGMNNAKVGKSIEKLASGFKINRAGDDASGLAISEKMKAQIKGLETASVNSLDGISLIQTAEGALTEVHAMLNRMVEIVGKAANGTMDDAVDRKALQAEVDALLEEIDRIAEGTNFNGINLLDGSHDGSAGNDALTLQVGDTSESFNKMSVAIKDMSTKGLGLTGLTAAPPTTNITKVDVTELKLAQESMDLFKTAAGGGAINLVSTQRAALGALQNRLEYTINNLDVAAENLSAANSRIRDTDMAKEMMEYTKMNVLTQAAQSMLAQANMQPQSILQLLQ